MTNKEREKLIEDMEIAILKEGVGTILHSTQLSRMAIAALAIAERRIREDCAGVASGRYWSSALGSDGTAKAISTAILASIPEKKDEQG